MNFYYMDDRIGFVEIESDTSWLMDDFGTLIRVPWTLPDYFWQTNLITPNERSLTMNSYENPQLSYECDLTAERDRLRAINAELWRRWRK